MSTEDDVRKASTQFYACLNRMVGGDSASMLDILSRLQAPAS